MASTIDAVGLDQFLLEISLLLTNMVPPGNVMN